MDAQRWKYAVVDAPGLDHHDDSQLPWETVWKRIRPKVFPRSGEWLSQDSKFTRWVQGIGSRVIGLEGDEGTGKTLLASSVIIRLRKMKTIGPCRVVVAHNFSEPDAEAAPAGTADAMSRNLLCQLAFGHMLFMKSAASTCERCV